MDNLQEQRQEGDRTEHCEAHDKPDNASDREDPEGYRKPFSVSLLTGVSVPQ